MSGLRRKDHFDDKLGALNPNALPDYIASQIVDSPYFTRLLGNDLSEAHSAVEEQKDRSGCCLRGVFTPEKCPT